MIAPRFRDVIRRVGGVFLVLPENQVPGHVPQGSIREGLVDEPAQAPPQPLPAYPVSSPGVPAVKPPRE